MSALGGAVGVALALIVEEVILTNKGGPSAVSGIFGTIGGVVTSIANPDVPAIPDLSAKKNSKPPTKGKS